MAGYAELQKEVIGVGLCTNCGTCVGVCANKSIVMNYEAEEPEQIRECPENCHLCHQACKDACPIHTDVPGYLYSISRSDFQAAYELIRKDNPLPAVCGRVCDHPCEEACNRGQVDDPLAITALKRFATDQVDIDKLSIPKITKNHKKVAIIGSGPAGLAAANDLALLGYNVTIFEALPEPGGMLRVGIPEYRLPKDILRKDIGYIQRLGVEIKTGVKIGEQVSLKELRKSHQAIFIATGAQQNRKLDIKSIELDGVLWGVDFLRQVNLGKLKRVKGRVVVIGGGNVAVDVALTALRLGAKEVQLACLESREQMPAFPWEIKQAREEGVMFNVSWGPKRIVGKDNKVTGVELVGCTSVFDRQGKFNPSFDESKRTTLPADTVILAIGQAPDISFIKKDKDVRTSTDGLILVDPTTFQTSAPGVFAGGDAVSGGKTVIDAIAAGKKVARYIDRHIKGEPLVAEEQGKIPQKLTEGEIAIIKQRWPSQSRVGMAELALRQRQHNFAEVESGYTVEQAQQEAYRCLSSQDEQPCSRVCPGKEIPMPELERFVFGRNRTAEEEWVGCGQEYLIAHSTDPIIRINGSSGGTVTALFLYALENNIIDAAIVCSNSSDRPWRVIPKIVTTKEDLFPTSQSKLSTVPMNSLLSEAVEKGYKRLGIVGHPCHVAGIRKMQMLGKPKKIIDSIKFAIGLCCGSNWTYKSVEHIIQEFSRVPINKVAKWRARDGAYPGLWTVYCKDGRKVVLPPDSARRALSMAFRRERCGVCYDYSSELADITAGDYFGPTMKEGSPGETATIIRTDVGRALVKGAEAAGYIETSPIDRQPFTWGGFEMKKLGGKYHIVERRKFGHPTPDFGWPMDYPKPLPRGLPKLHPHE